ncbi:S-adenosyl-L-methionine-dependent methyltransferase [Cladochytrium replicatum]|nr:S-adenosyl-L-methionine-dependent methyltransferase [Cladochytrium replicatum]
MGNTLSIRRQRNARSYPINNPPSASPSLLASPSLSQYTAETTAYNASVSARHRIQTKGLPSAWSDAGGSSSSVLNSPAPSTTSTFMSDPLLKHFSPLSSPDVTEGTRLSMQQYYLLRGIFKGTYAGVTRHDLEHGLKVLDAGSTTGIWLAEMERDFPNGQYWAVDLSVSLWPDTEFVNGSKKLNVAETQTLGRLPFDDNFFDYVHEQTQLFITPEGNWSHVISELCRVLKPGGYIDLVELDPYPAVFPTPLISDYLNRYLTHMRAGGFNLRGASKVADAIEATGKFTDIQVVRRTAPIGWDGHLGALWRIHLKEGYMGLRTVMGPASRPGGGVPSEAEYDAFLERFFDDCAAHQSFCNSFRVSARKRDYAMMY